jgi:hypothetical protein
MGFKKVDGIPEGVVRRHGCSIYTPLINEVHSKGGTYALDVKDNKRAHSLAATIRQVARKMECSDVKVVVRLTVVYVTKKEDDVLSSPDQL